MPKEDFPLSIRLRRRDEPCRTALFRRASCRWFPDCSGCLDPRPVSAQCHCGVPRRSARPVSAAYSSFQQRSCWYGSKFLSPWVSLRAGVSSGIAQLENNPYKRKQDGDDYGSRFAPITPAAALVKVRSCSSAIFTTKTRVRAYPVKPLTKIASAARFSASCSAQALTATVPL